MQQHELKPDAGSTSARKRVGRGYASGLGKTSGFGQKGQKARTGHHKVPVWFEGAPSKVNTIKRTGYKRGVSFNNPFRTEYETVSLDQLADWEGGDITPESLAAAGLVKRKLHVKPYKVQGEDVLRYKPVKVLGDGEVTRPLTVRVHRLTASAKQKITAAGGTFQELTPAKTKAEE